MILQPTFPTSYKTDMSVEGTMAQECFFEKFLKVILTEISEAEESLFLGRDLPKCSLTIAGSITDEYYLLERDACETFHVYRRYL